ncbi:MAG TPA: 4Fe-4S dicluster domain-containing protein [Candidatus Krumholzibacterium sp.]|nr:4Fe-4S dicluster domain-containing protein [Candidatus Krumholzibacterium sp.]
MAKWVMAIDLDRCTGCGSCMVACKMENNVPVVSHEDALDGKVMNWMDMITEYEGDYPNIEVRRMPKPCFHCDHPPCTRVCPVGATYRNPEGLVGQVYHRCIGCRYCMVACPYTAKVFNYHDPVMIEGADACYNPDVSRRMVGVVEKCSFCSHRLIKARERADGEDRPIDDGEYQPACAEICPADAIYFGDIEDKSSTVYRMSRDYRAARLMDDLGTEPKVYYLAKRT